MKRIASLILLFCALPLFAAPKTAAIVKVSGDRQSGFSGYALTEDFVVRVTENGKPLSEVPVAFTVVTPPAPDTGRHGREAQVSPSLALTDRDGYAHARLRLGDPSPQNVIVTAASRDTLQTPVVFSSDVRPKSFIVVLVLGLFGGLGVFLFGMLFMNEALQKIAGQKLRETLTTLAGSSVKGFGTGLLVTLINQTSTATTLLEVSLVSAGLLTFYQTMAVTMGAEVGSTVTAQLIAFNIAELSVVIAGLGFYISFLARTKKGKQIGNAILGFGLLFLGMKIMADLMTPLRTYGPFLELMENVENPLLGIGVGMLFTVAVHSSGATSAIVIALALAGAISLPQAIPLNLGAQIGTCVTAFLGAIGRGREGKRVAIWHVIHQTAGVLLILPFLTIITYQGEPAWIHFIRWFTAVFFGTADLARQIAMAHTLASVVNALVFFPFLPLIGAALIRIFPSHREERPFGPMYIDDGLLDTPALALDQARKEVVREGEIVLEMMEDSIRVFDTQDLKLGETVSLRDVRADMLRNAIVPYLTKIAQNTLLTEEQSARETQLLYITSDIEGIGDIIDKNIMPLARKKLQNNLWFSDEGWKDIVDLHGRVTLNLQRVVEALRSNDLEKARLAVESKAEINGYQAELRRRHIERLHSGLQEALETSSVHLDLIEQIKRINSLISSVGYTLLGWSK